MSAQWAAHFLVAAELERKGYVVTFTMGHSTPAADLMVGHSNGDQFWIDVKGQKGINSWFGKKKKVRKNLYYVLVRLGKCRSKDRFFILSQKNWNSLIDNYAKGHSHRTTNGFNPGAPYRFEDKWEKLPSWSTN